MTKIAAFGPDIQYEAPAARQVNADSQREAWLRQMESAQISMLDKAGEQVQGGGAHGPQDQQSQNPGNANRDMTRAAAWNADGNTYGFSAHALTSTGVRDQVGVGVSPDIAAAVGNHTLQTVVGTTPVQGLCSTVQAPLSSDGTPSVQDLSAATRSTRPTGELNSVGQSVGAVVPVTQLPPKGSGQLDMLTQISPFFASPVDLANSLIAQPSVSVAARNVSDVSSAQPSASVFARSVSNAASAQPTLSFSMGSGTEAGEELNEVAEQPASKGAGEAADTQGAEWQKRMLHLTQDGRDVSVSIRDQTLSQSQSSHVVYRLIADVANTGLRLRNATVNGRQVMRLGRLGTSSAPSRQGISSQGAVDSNNQTYTKQEKQHGT